MKNEYQIYLTNKDTSSTMDSFDQSGQNDTQNELSLLSTSFDNSNERYFPKQTFFQNSSIIAFSEINHDELDQMVRFEIQNDFDNESIEDNNLQINLKLKKPRKKRRRQIAYDKKSRNRQLKTKRTSQLPSIPFSLQEDRNILHLVLEVGPKFEKISTFFPFRTLHAIKNRFYKILRFKWHEILGEEYISLNAIPEQIETQNQCEANNFFI